MKMMAMPFWTAAALASTATSRLLSTRRGLLAGMPRSQASSARKLLAFPAARLASKFRSAASQLITSTPVVTGTATT